MFLLKYTMRLLLSVESIFCYIIVVNLLFWWQNFDPDRKAVLAAGVNVAHLITIVLSVFGALEVRRLRRIFKERINTEDKKKQSTTP